MITRDVNGEEELIGGCSDLKASFETQAAPAPSEDTCSPD